MPAVSETGKREVWKPHTWAFLSGSQRGFSQVFFLSCSLVPLQLEMFHSPVAVSCKYKWVNWERCWELHNIPKRPLSNACP